MKKENKKWTVLDLLSKANDLLDTFQPDVALTFCQKAFDQEPGNVLVLQTLASILLELGQVEQARTHLLTSLDVEPQSGYEKFLALAQISEGMEALHYYQKGFGVLKGEREVYEMSQEEGDGKLASILCSQAELWMTDLCMEEGAEQECEKALTEARALAPREPEVLRLFSDLRMVQCRPEDAKVEALACYHAFADMDLTAPQYPSFDLRTALARNFVELECYEEADQLLQVLLQEDDEHLMNLYLFAMVCYFLQHRDECLEACATMLKRLEKDPNAELLEATTELQEKASALPEEMDQDDEHQADE